MTRYCTYCGRPATMFCCGDRDLLTRDEYCNYHGIDPVTGEPPERRDTAPDYRTAEQFYADQAHERKRRMLRGED